MPPDSELNQYENPTRPPIKAKLLRITKVLILSVGIFSLVLGLFILHQYQAPRDFPVDESVIIEPGVGVATIVEQFEAANYVRSSTLLQAFLVLVYDATAIKAGTYTFLEPHNVQEIARMITEVGPQEPLLSLTFPEGMRVRQFAMIADNELDNFDLATFMSYAEDYEGHLFPETYFVPERFSDAALFDLLRATYEEKIEPLRPAIDGHALSEEEVIILASIIEREANSPESMRLVSSVLQNRLAIDMPLQADASIEYVLDKPLSELTPEDLEIDTPYNTYLYNGLPPTPIGNPGLDAIRAVLEPADTDYFYYITDPSGTFHFAETFDEHRRNIAQYLR